MLAPPHSPYVRHITVYFGLPQSGNSLPLTNLLTFVWGEGGEDTIPHDSQQCSCLLNAGCAHNSIIDSLVQVIIVGSIFWPGLVKDKR